MNFVKKFVVVLFYAVERVPIFFRTFVIIDVSANMVLFHAVEGIPVD